MAFFYHDLRDRQVKMSDSSAIPSVSVIVPVRNSERTLPGLFACLRALEYPADRLQVLMVDNHSTDHSAELIRAAGFTCLREDRVSSYAARNAGLARAEGEILAFTDADCRPDPAWLRAGVSCLLRESADLVAGQVLMEVQDPANVYELYSATHDLDPRASFQEGYAITANLLVRRRVFDKLGGFNPWMISGGDRLFTEQAVNAGFRMVFCDKALVRHPARVTPRSLAAANFRRAFGSMQLRQYGRRLPAAFREWRYYLPGLRPYREFSEARPLGFADRIRIFFLIWRLKLAQVRGSWAGHRFCRRHPPPPLQEER